MERKGIDGELVENLCWEISWRSKEDCPAASNGLMIVLRHYLEGTIMKVRRANDPVVVYLLRGAPCLTVRTPDTAHEPKDPVED